MVPGAPGRQLGLPSDFSWMLSMEIIKNQPLHLKRAARAKLTIINK